MLPVDGGKLRPGLRAHGKRNLAANNGAGVFRQVGNADASRLIHAPEDIPAVRFQLPGRIVIGGNQLQHQGLADKFDQRRHGVQLRFVEAQKDDHRCVSKVEVWGGEIGAGKTANNVCC